MPTDRERIRTLVAVGLLPETAQDIVETDVLSDDAKNAARITARDRARVRTFVLYSPLIPDPLRLMFDVETVDEYEPA